MSSSSSDRDITSINSTDRIIQQSSSNARVASSMVRDVKCYVQQLREKNLDVNQDNCWNQIGLNWNKFVFPNSDCLYDAKEAGEKYPEIMEKTNWKKNKIFTLPNQRCKNTIANNEKIAAELSIKHNGESFAREVTLITKSVTNLLYSEFCRHEACC